MLWDDNCVAPSDDLYSIKSGNDEVIHQHKTDAYYMLNQNGIVDTNNSMDEIAEQQEDEMQD